MANIGITLTLNGTVGDVIVSSNQSKTDYVSGSGMVANDQVIGVTPEDLDIPVDVSEVGVVTLQNDNPNVDVWYGGATDLPFMVRRNGGVAMFEVRSGETVKIRTSAGTFAVNVLAIARGTTTTTTTTTT